jgi:hypothetical protein
MATNVKALTYSSDMIPSVFLTVVCSAVITAVAIDHWDVAIPANYWMTAIFFGCIWVIPIGLPIYKIFRGKASYHSFHMLKIWTPFLGGFFLEKHWPKYQQAELTIRQESAVAELRRIFGAWLDISGSTPLDFQAIAREIAEFEDENAVNSHPSSNQWAVWLMQAGRIAALDKAYEITRKDLVRYAVKELADSLELSSATKTWANDHFQLDKVLYSGEDFSAEAERVMLHKAVESYNELQAKKDGDVENAEVILTILRWQGYYVDIANHTVV